MHVVPRMQNLNAYLYDLNLTQQIKRGVLYLFYTDQFKYRPGERVQMNLFKINLSSRDVNLTYLTTQYYDFLVKQEKQIIWRWSHGKYFLQVMQQKILGPGEVARVEEEWWIPKDFQLGVYTLEGRNLATPDTKFQVQIEIIS